MTEEKTNKSTQKETSDKKESLFYIHDLRENSRELFGVKPEVLDGVFANTKEIQVTKSKAEKRIDAFLKRKVGDKGNKKGAK